MQRYSVRERRGAIAIMTALLLVVLIGMVAMAVDVGWIYMAKAQSQAAADSGALSGGTELISGLGAHATKTSAEVAAAVRPVAKSYAEKHRIAEQSSAYVDSSTDIQLGTAVYDESTGAWQKTVGGTPYNMVRVTVHRDRAASGNNDKPLPLFFARIFGNDRSNVSAVGTAVLMPANGFSLPPGSDQNADIAPFAFRAIEWERFLRAQDHYETTGLTAAPTADPLDPYYNQTAVLSDGNTHYLYHHTITNSNNSTEEVTSWADNFTYDHDTHTVTNVGDGNLELDIYPTSSQQQYSGGNFGTLDIPEGNNSTSHLYDQIVDGISAEDLNAWKDDVGDIEFGEDNPFVSAEGDPGISNALQTALEAIIGECRAATLFNAVDEGVGNNTTYQLVGWAGLHIVNVDMSGSPKHVWVEACSFSAGGAIPDLDTAPGSDTTVFAPLILIE